MQEVGRAENVVMREFKWPRMHRANVTTPGAPACNPRKRDRNLDLSLIHSQDVLQDTDIQCSALREGPRGAQIQCPVEAEHNK